MDERVEVSVFVRVHREVRWEARKAAAAGDVVRPERPAVPRPPAGSALRPAMLGRAAIAGVASYAAAYAAVAAARQLGRALRAGRALDAGRARPALPPPSDT